MATEQEEKIQTTEKIEISVLNEKFADALAIPGFTIEFEPEEADRVGAFLEDALSEKEALDSSIDREEW